MHYGNLRHVLLHGVVAIGIIFARKLNPRFSRDDAILIPVFLATYFALLDLGFGKTPYPTALRAAIVVFRCGFLFPHSRSQPRRWLFSSKLTAGRVAAIAWIVASGVALTPCQRADRSVRATLAFVVYPIALLRRTLALVGIDRRRCSISSKTATT